MVHPRACCSLSSLLMLEIVLLLTLCTSSGTIVKDESDQISEFCPVESRVDLSHAEFNSSGFLSNSGHFFAREKARYADGAWYGCFCDLRPCLSICSSLNTTRKNGTDVHDDEFPNYTDIPKVYTTSLIIDDDRERSNTVERFHILAWDPCKEKGGYFLNPKKYKGDEFYLLGNGTIFLPRRDSPGKQFLDFRKYCLKQKLNETIYTPRVCARKKNVPNDGLGTLKYIGCLIAVPFVIATIIVYSILPELRNIHGTTLRCYLSCLLVTYVALAADRIPPPDITAGISCLILGFTIYFSFLASFFWLNVMCIDMWWRFGGFGSLVSSGRNQDRKKFIGYSIYAWGSSVLLTAICIGMDFIPGIPDSLIRPEFKANSCWFKSAIAAALYFYGPVGVTIACNIYLFISTSIKIAKHKKNTERHLNTGDSKRHDDNEQWFSLYLKLSIVMGISWSTEVISWLWKEPKYLWYLTDMVNAFQGLLIFLIFVWKKKIWQSLKKRYDQKFAQRSLDSPATSASSDDTVRCSVSVLVLEDRNNPQNPNPATLQSQNPTDLR